MKKLIGIIAIIIIVVIGILIYFSITNNNNSEPNQNSNESVIENNSNNEENINEKNNLGEEEIENMKMRVSDGSHNIIFELNDSESAKSLYEQLPLTLQVDNFSSNEKIFYPTNELNTDNTPHANGGGAGTLAYYAPWGDVVMFYDSFSSASGLYELGSAIEGRDQIESLSGEIIIEKLEN